MDNQPFKATAKKRSTSLTSMVDELNHFEQVIKDAQHDAHKVKDDIVRELIAQERWDLFSVNIAKVKREFF